jgi:intracellular sulfur oxidation DsrE/DsrF family protein
LMKRGASFMVCHNATTAFAGMLGQGVGVDPKSALADFVANMLPGFLMVPAGVAAVQAAQTNGWKLFPII